eukprot:TRINITY_DN836_c0_g2_i5.p1 TRINITY_DN836_c0_g2~~TRINITY_DN836_c0_g2_i5.p1  ORF type:complete len:732 (-),score=124.26 TRINITY_DN836_c0_g2_i5:133-2328(-)
MEVRYRVEYAKSGRSSCSRCKGQLMQFKFRFGKDIPSPHFDGYMTKWFHAKCFFNKFKGTIVSRDIKGFDHLKPKHQKMIKEWIGEQVDTESDEVVQKFWDLREDLKQRTDPSELRKALEYNNCRSDGGPDRLIAKTAESMTYGIARCPVCSQPELEFTGGRFHCHGATEWGKCTFVGLEDTVTIIDWRVDPTWSNDFLKSFNYVRNPRPKQELREITEKKPIARVAPRTKESSDPEGLAKYPNGSLFIDKQGNKYNLTLNQTDISLGINSYYLMQIIIPERELTSNFILYAKWGRVGTTIGNTMYKKFESEQDVLREWEEKYLDKTGNEWKNRANFEKKPMKYFPIETEEDDSKSNEVVDTNNIPSLLDTRVQSLVKLIFDTKMIAKTLLDMNIDVKKMPLGKLTQAHIKKGYEVLTRIEAVMNNNITNTKSYELSNLSNQFYTLIPHDFGFQIPVVINTPERLKSKMKQMETLLEIQIASSLLTEVDEYEKHLNPVDVNYRKLKCKLVPIEKSSPKYQMIERYLTNTFEPEYYPFTIELEDVFDVERHLEAQRFSVYDAAPSSSKMLLWHGSRLSNWVGIISQGLRIAPPEAPITGYMFGKGVYFGDMVSKSAEYCYPTPENNTGVLLLSNVYLGMMQELDKPSYMEKPPAGCDSCHALSRVQPNPWFVEEWNGSLVPLGHGIPYYPEGFLSHSEYIVYNVDQVHSKYLLRVKFNYHSHPTPLQMKEMK